MKFKIRRPVRRDHDKLATLLVRGADLVLLRDLLGRALWDKALEAREAQRKLVDTQGLPLPRPRTKYLKKQVRQKCQVAYLDE